MNNNFMVIETLEDVVTAMNTNTQAIVKNLITVDKNFEDVASDIKKLQKRVNGLRRFTGLLAAYIFLKEYKEYKKNPDKKVVYQSKGE